MKAYHLVSPDRLQSVLDNGIVKESRGDKGDDKAIVKTDEYLDERRLNVLKDAGISRDNNIYAYVAVQDSIIDITDGEQIPINEYVKNSSDSVVEVTIDPKRCYVSDLDTYDALKEAIVTHKNPMTLETLAKSYWDKLIPLAAFEVNAIRRPEIMVTYDISPQDIRPIS